MGTQLEHILPMQVKARFRRVAAEVAAQPVPWRACIASEAPGGDRDPWTAWLTGVLHAAPRPLTERAIDALTYVSRGALLSVLCAPDRDVPAAAAIASFELAVDRFLPGGDGVAVHVDLAALSPSSN